MGRGLPRFRRTGQDLIGGCGEEHRQAERRFAGPRPGLRVRGRPASRRLCDPSPVEVARFPSTLPPVHCASAHLRLVSRDRPVAVASNGDQASALGERGQCMAGTGSSAFDPRVPLARPSMPVSRGGEYLDTAIGTVPSPPIIAINCAARRAPPPPPLDPGGTFFDQGGRRERGPDGPASVRGPLGIRPLRSARPGPRPIFPRLPTAMPVARREIPPETADEGFPPNSIRRPHVIPKRCVFGAIQPPLQTILYAIPGQEPVWKGGTVPS